MPFVTTWMGLEITIPKLSKADKDKYHVMLLICGISNSDTNELIYKIETDSQTQKTILWLPKGKDGGEGINWEFEIGIYTLLYLKSMINKDQLNSTELLNTLQ